jgi:hypothetical protein
VCAWRSYYGYKQAGCKADHSLPSNGEIKNEWRYISTPEYEFLTCIGTTFFPFMLICKYSKHFCHLLLKSSFKSQKCQFKYVTTGCMNYCWLRRTSSILSSKTQIHALSVLEYRSNKHKHFFSRMCAHLLHAIFGNFRTVAFAFWYLALSLEVPPGH